MFAVPEAMTEPDDMDIVQSLCRPYGPIKVSAGRFTAWCADLPSLTNPRASRVWMQKGEHFHLIQSSRIHCGYDIQH